MPSDSYPDATSVTRALGDATPLRGRTTRALFDYWRNKRGERPYPAWDEVHLIDLWQVAPCLSVKDVIDGGSDFRARYWGTRLAEAVGADISGRSVGEIPGIDIVRAFVNFRGVANTGQPLLSYRRLAFIDQREHVDFEAVHLPLGPAGGPVAQVISAFDFDCDVADILGGRESA